MSDSPSALPRPLRWGILGTGFIAQQFARSLPHSQLGILAGVASRSAVRPLPEVFGSAQISTDYDSLLASEEVDAIYVATPHPTHAALTIRAAEAGKHVLCEKPIAMNAPEATAVADVAKAMGVTVMEAFMYRAHPQTAKLVALLQAGAIGKIRLIQASFGYRTAFDPAKRHFDLETGGGAILDVGCYCVSACRLVAGVASGKPFAEPVDLKAIAAFAPTGADERTSALMRFDGDILAQVSASITTAQDNRLRIFGDDGQIEVTSPWFCSGREGGQSTIVVKLPAGEETHTIDCTDWLYALEADAFARAVAGEAVWPAPSLEDSVGNMQALDAWRKEIELTYPCEGPSRSVTASGRPLGLLPDAVMPYDTTIVPGKRASKLAVGGMLLRTFPHAAVIYDAFFEAGGTVIDSAHIYGQGLVDRQLGAWMKSRGVRDQVVVIGKGAHTPNCRPDAIEPQLEESLDRLQTDHIDLYFLHRDDPSVPVGEFVDVLDSLRRAGRIGRFGGSNWTTARIDEAQAYARRAGKFGLDLLSNNFSLAEMVQPMWPGCISSSDPESREWLQRTQTPLFAWSSQARGFFTDRAGRDKLDDKLMVDSWYSETNFARRDRVRTLAAKLGVAPTHIAMAYLLAQPFPIFPIIGPVTPAELRDSLGGLRTSLSVEDAQWLLGNPPVHERRLHGL